MKTAIPRVPESVSELFGGLSDRRPGRRPGRHKRRRTAASFAACSESCERRILLTELPVLRVTAADRYTIFGDVVDNRWDNQVTVEVDLLNDGTVDHTLNANHDGVMDIYLWDLVTNGEGPKEGYDVALKPISNGVDGQRIGAVVVVQISAEVNEAPVITAAAIDEFFLSGQIEDDMVGLAGGMYDVEVAVGNGSTEFTKWGEVDYEGRFMTGTNLPQNQGVIKVYVRVKEVTHAKQLVSNVVELDYDSNASGNNGLASGQSGSPNGGNADGGTGGDGTGGDSGADGGGGSSGWAWNPVRTSSSVFGPEFVRSNALESSLFGVPGALDELLA